METIEYKGKVYQVGGLYRDGEDGEIGELVSFNAAKDRPFILLLCDNDIRTTTPCYSLEVVINAIGTITDAPVKLVDGSAYQFEYNESVASAIYDGASEKFRFFGSFVASSYCTNIVKLIPEVK